MPNFISVFVHIFSSSAVSWLCLLFESLFLSRLDRNLLKGSVPTNLNNLTNMIELWVFNVFFPFHSEIKALCEWCLVSLVCVSLQEFGSQYVVWSIAKSNRDGLPQLCVKTLPPSLSMLVSRQCSSEFIVPSCFAGTWATTPSSKQQPLTGSLACLL